MTTQQAIELIKSGRNEITSTILKDLIADHVPLREYMIKRYNEYAGEVEIKNRIFDNPNKINNKLANDYRGEIVDSIVGYLFGVPIRWTINPKNYNETEIEKINEYVDDFLTRNDVADLDSTTGEYATICGRAVRLLWVDRQGTERAMNIAPWEVILVEDATVEEVIFAMIYYNITEVDSSLNKTVRRVVEWYDDKTVTYYIEDASGNYILNPSHPVNPVPHLFDFVPVIPFYNSNLKASDFDKVSSLIDAYDRTLSDVQNEIEEFRLAYLAFFGVEPTKEAMQEARRSGAFGMDVGEDIRFITKNLNVEAIKDHKDTLKENIYHFSKTVDMSDEKFSGGTQSGESRRWKLQSFENRAITKERKFTKGLRQMVRVLTSAWAKKGLDLKPEHVKFIFTRNLPVDQAYMADIAVKLKGIASDETTLSFVPGVQDPKAEMEKIRQEEEERYSIDPAKMALIDSPAENNQ